MKTPDEIKNGLECCVQGNVCRKNCPYGGSPHGIVVCTANLSRDALAYIQQLEAANDELLTKVKQLTAKCRQLERERDAAVGDLHYLVNHPLSAGPCYACAHTKDCYSVGNCDTAENDRWEWRGVKEE